MSPTKVYLSIARGDSDLHAAKQRAHQEVVDWLKKNGPTYGLASTVEELDGVQRETLQSLFEGENVSRLLSPLLLV
jgi:hypothetical protein